MITLLLDIFVFAIGAIIGSFLNVCIHRLPKNESVIMPASHCPKCKRNILWYDNIPILSYMILRGKCRFCRGKIAFRYPLVEIITAVLTLLLFIVFGPGIKLFSYALLSFGLIIATFVDFEINEIPDQVSIGGLVAGLALSIAGPRMLDTASRPEAFLNSFLGILVGGGSIYLLGFFGELVFRKEAMGGGDVKLMAMIGAFLGWKLVMFTFFVAPVFGAIAGIILKVKDGRQIIPYGPYISLAALVSVFWGNQILGFLFYGLY